jgi:MinD superfamily P-loop ATPase
MNDSLAGYWFISDTKYGNLVHARLNPSKENSGKLVAMVRKQARNLAEKHHSEYIITDGPPGTGCPVISSLSGADIALTVTEPTLSGIHDLERIIGVCEHFNVPALVCINKYDINYENTERIEDYCKNQGLKIAGRIPYDEAVTEAMVRNQTVVDYTSGNISNLLEEIWETVENTVKG